VISVIIESVLYTPELTQAAKKGRKFVTTA